MQPAQCSKQEQDPGVIEDITEKRWQTVFGQPNLTSDSNKQASPGF